MLPFDMVEDVMFTGTFDIGVGVLCPLTRLVLLEGRVAETYDAVLTLRVVSDNVSGAQSYDCRHTFTPIRWIDDEH